MIQEIKLSRTINNLKVISLTIWVSSRLIKTRIVELLVILDLKINKRIKLIKTNKTLALVILLKINQCSSRRLLIKISVTLGDRSRNKIFNRIRMISQTLDKLINNKLLNNLIILEDSTITILIHKTKVVELTRIRTRTNYSSNKLLNKTADLTILEVIHRISINNNITKEVLIILINSLNNNNLNSNLIKVTKLLIISASRISQLIS